MVFLRDGVNNPLRLGNSPISDLWKRFRISVDHEFIKKYIRSSMDTVLEFWSSEALCTLKDNIFCISAFKKAVLTIFWKHLNPVFFNTVTSKRITTSKISKSPPVRSLRIRWSTSLCTLCTSLRLQIPWTYSLPTLHSYSKKIKFSPVSKKISTCHHENLDLSSRKSRQIYNKISTSHQENLALPSWKGLPVIMKISTENVDRS